MLEILNDLKPFLPSKKEQAKILAKHRKESIIKNMQQGYECIYLAFESEVLSANLTYIYENKSIKCLNEREFIKKIFKNIKIKIFCTKTSKKSFRDSKIQTIITLDEKYPFISQITQHLNKSSKYILAFSKVEPKFLMELANLSKVYDIEFLDFKQNDNCIKVSKINGLFEEDFSNVAFALNQFELSLKMPYLPTNEHLYVCLKDFSRLLLTGNITAFMPKYIKIKNHLDNLDKTSIFYPFRKYILNILNSFRINEIKNSKKDDNFMIFNNYLLLARLFYIKGYFINSAILLKEGIDYGVYDYFMGDYNIKAAKKDRFNLFWQSFLSDANINAYIKRYLRAIYEIRCDVARIRNSFVHIEGLFYYSEHEKNLKTILDNIHQLFNPYALSKLEPYKEQIAKKIRQKLQSN